ncbi:uncharacterized protein [Setaria viridis]|uniref:Uncharacterized protein n=1 Tax=Setaria viridis TaxID=4556 RepID=A0A4U6T2Z5_SETVI|nr:hypothetical protein SEVIR_9G282750v2 [Setaria viridis]
MEITLEVGAPRNCRRPARRLRFCFQATPSCRPHVVSLSPHVLVNPVGQSRGCTHILDESRLMTPVSRSFGHQFGSWLFISPKGHAALNACRQGFRRATVFGTS